MGKNTKVAVSFDEMIQADRKKRKAEELAQQIFGRNRSTDSPAGNKRSNNQSPVGGSLASRVGVNKKAPSQQRGASFSNDRRQNNASDRRQNQLQSHNLNKSQNSRNQRRPFGESNTASNSPRLQAQAAPQANLPEASFNNVEINIRGAAGPYCVVASNFAPGTTAADIESVMAPVGGEMLGCKLISASPTVIVEMVFVERSGAENVIAMFNNKKADGRVLYVYMKEGGPSQTVFNSSANAAHARPASTAPSAPTPAPRAPSPRPLQQASNDTMEVDPDTLAANDAAYNANSMDNADANGSARSHDNAPPRAPIEPRETYRPPPRDDRPMYYDDHANNHHGGYGYQDQQQHPRQGGGGYGGGYRDDRRGGRFRNEGRMYSDSLGRGNGRYRR